MRDSPIHSVAIKDNDPTIHASTTAEPKTNVDRSSKVLDENASTADFDGAKQVTGLQYADFRDDKIFPAFADLPEENDIDLTFYKTTNGFRYTPRKHWCFLAEIVDIENFIRLTLFVRDKANNTVRLAFYTEGRGAEVPPSQVQIGHTVAILYAIQHGFLDMSTGVRQEESSGVKIIPTSLNELFKLSDRVRQYSSEVDGKRTCHGCDESKMGLQKCSHCSLFWYCNKSCQMTGWSGKGHKRDCKLLRDKDLCSMFLMDWNHFEDFAQFPLDVTRILGRASKVESMIPQNDNPAAKNDNEPSIKSSPGPVGVDTSSAFDNDVDEFVKRLSLGNIDSATDEYIKNEAQGLEKEAIEVNPSEERSKDIDAPGDQAVREDVWRQIKREKAIARAEQTIRDLTNRRNPSEGRPEKGTPVGKETEMPVTVDVHLIQRCLRSLIPSLAATTGTDILELINLDILNESLGLKLDISAAWKRVLAPEASFDNIVTYLGGCAPDPSAWRIMRREFKFRSKAGQVLWTIEQSNRTKNTSRDSLIHLLESLERVLLGDDVKWEIIPDSVPRAVMKIAIAVAKNGSDPPGIHLEDEDFRIDPFFAMIADKSESSLFGTPDEDDPRYWDYWMRRDGFGTDKS